jgi:hypothetical protein
MRSGRLVALFDILGFGHRLKREPLLVVRHQIREFIRQIRTQVLTDTSAGAEPGSNDNVDLARFVFDSVLLVSDDPQDIHTVHRFVFASLYLLELGFLRNFPFRGSMAMCDIVSDDETGLVIGTAFPELRDAERMQEWTGCFVHESAAPVVLDAIFGAGATESRRRSPSASDVLHWLEVPIKNQYRDLRPFYAWCLNWAGFLDARAVPAALDYLKGDPAKYSATGDYVRYIRSLPCELTPLQGPQVPDGTFVKAMKARCGFRAAFVDREGNGIALPGGVLKWSAMHKGERVGHGQAP